ncbi:MAG: hypothetical protein PHI12_06675 [Dehalococcoidales bacterium]|nr:hypothetical protein [Dehalococcoidales bacterium]
MAKKQPLYPHVPQSQLPSKGPFQFYAADADVPIKVSIEVEPMSFLTRKHAEANIHSALRMANWIFENLTADAAKALRDNLSTRLGE